MNAQDLPVVGALIKRLQTRNDHEAVKGAMASKGDLTKVQGYAELSKCISALSTLDVTFKGGLGRPLRVIRETEGALLKHRDLFKKAFAQGGTDAGRLAYSSAVAGLYAAVSVMCATCVRFEAVSGRYAPVLDAEGVKSLDASIIIKRLEEFNSAAGKSGFVALVTTGAQSVEREAIGEAWGAIAITAAAVAGVTALLFLARDMAEYFYSLRGTFARWLEVQARFLEMNASTLGSGMESTRAKQEDYARKLRAVADRVRVDDADATRQATRAIADSDRELRQAQEVAPSQSGGVSPIQVGGLV